MGWYIVVIYYIVHHIFFFFLRGFSIKNIQKNSGIFDRQSLLTTIFSNHDSHQYFSNVGKTRP